MDSAQSSMDWKALALFICISLGLMWLACRIDDTPAGIHPFSIWPRLDAVPIVFEDVAPPAYEAIFNADETVSEMQQGYFALGAMRKTFLSGRDLGGDINWIELPNSPLCK